MSPASPFGWLRSLTHRSRRSPRGRRGVTPPGKARFIPRLQALEFRDLPSTFTVLNLADSGAGSLRAAVLAANANPGADVINFAVTGTITLTGGQLTLTDDLTIDGPGAVNLTVRGNLSRVFDVTGGVNATIAGLTVAHGLAGQGGGVLNEAGATLTLAHCTLTENTARGLGDSGGGAIFNAAGAHLTITQCLLSQNRAIATPGHDEFGGGLLNAGTAAVTGSRFEGNEVIGGGGASIFAGSVGGAIDNAAAATLRLTSSTFIGNQAVGAAGAFFGLGGAVSNDLGAKASITTSTFTNNVASGGPGSTGNGGAINNLAATMTLTDCLLTGNQSLGGSGGNGSSTFGQGLGGAICNQIGGQLGVDFFGLPFLENSLTLVNCTVTGNLARGGDGGTEPGGFLPVGLATGGGAASFLGANLTLINSALLGNQAAGGTNAAGKGGPGLGGGIEIDLQSSLTVRHSTFSGNAAIGGGGGGGANGGDGAGGGIDIANDSTGTVAGSTFTNNQALGGQAGAGGTGGFGFGGGISVGYNVMIPGQIFTPVALALTLEGCTVTGNVGRGGSGGAGGNGGDGDGGGVAVLSSAASMNTSAITANQALAGSAGPGGQAGHGFGGGVYIAPIASASRKNTIIVGNFASTSDDDVFGSFTP